MVRAAATTCWWWSTSSRSSSVSAARTPTAPGDERAAFVRLLLEAAAQQAVPIYVVLTLRSDYIGECGRYPELAAAISASQFLVPRLTRDQLKAAIEGPAAVGGATVAPRLVQRLLGDVGEIPTSCRSSSTP